MMREFGLIGKTLDHSFSQKFFEEKFVNEKINNCSYELFELDDIEELPGLIESIPDLEGLNVTIPYKKTVLNYIDQLDEVAMETGAVNVLRIIRMPGKFYLRGYNTDVFGFEHSTRDILQYKNALILGRGGAAVSVAHALSNMGIRYKFVSRNPRDDQAIAYVDLDREIMNEHLLIINATPLGMHPNENSFPNIPYQFLTENHFLYDLIYNPEETEFLKKGMKYGAKTFNGLVMLEIQAEKAWEIWNE
jgi:shikimate dehydrogenase